MGECGARGRVNVLMGCRPCSERAALGQLVRDGGCILRVSVGAARVFGQEGCAAEGCAARK